MEGGAVLFPELVAAEAGFDFGVVRVGPLVGRVVEDSPGRE